MHSLVQKNGTYKSKRKHLQQYFVTVTVYKNIKQILRFSAPLLKSFTEKITAQITGIE